MIINGLISPVLKHTQRKGWEAMWRKRRKGHRHHGCTRTFPPCTWHRKLALSSKHFVEIGEDIQNGMYANLIFPPVLVIQGGLYLTLKSIVEIQLQCWKVLTFTILKHFHPYLNWIAFSLSRPHCHKLSDARWWESKIDIMLLWTEQPWHWPTEATEKNWEKGGRAAAFTSQGRTTNSRQTVLIDSETDKQMGVTKLATSMLCLCYTKHSCCVCNVYMSL